MKNIPTEKKKIIIYKRFDFLFVDWILFSLSWKRRIGVFASGDDAVIDIREFSEEKTFSESSRGVRLTPDQWKQLVDNIDTINNTLDKLSK